MSADVNCGTGRAASITRRSFLVASGAAVLASCGGGGSTGASSAGGNSGVGSSTGGGTAGSGATGSVAVNPTPVMTPASAALTRQALDAYLARSIVMQTWALFHPLSGDNLSQHQDNLRMIANLEAKHVSWAANFFWSLTSNFDVEPIMSVAEQIASDLHAQDPQIIVGAACFETTSPLVNNIAVPSWVFDEFGQPVVTRNFDWQQMVYSDQRVSDGNPNTPAIDITRLESRMWFYYWARRYIDLGYEDMHFGELITVTQNDLPSYTHYWDLVGRVRTYAASHARRGFILINAIPYLSDTAGNADWSGQYGVVNSDGYLLFDYYYAAIRPQENPNSPYDAILGDFKDTIFGRNRGGLSPNGWTCANCPYVVQFDPGASPSPGNAIGWPYVWGWAEWAWYVNQPDTYRHDWLWYANAWLAMRDSSGHFRMPGMGDGGGLPGIDWYHANIPWYSQTDPNAATRSEWFKGFNDEPVIKTIWSGTADPHVFNGTFFRPVLAGGQPDTTAPAVPSWSFSGQAGIATTGSSYVGSQLLAAGQQVAFISGSSSISQALLFPGAKSYQVQINAANRVVNGVVDVQSLAVELDGTVIGQVALGGSFATSSISLGSPPGGAHRVTISGSAVSSATAIIASVNVVNG